MAGLSGSNGMQPGTSFIIYTLTVNAFLKSPHAIAHVYSFTDNTRQNPFSIMSGNRTLRILLQELLRYVDDDEQLEVCIPVAT